MLKLASSLCIASVLALGPLPTARTASAEDQVLVVTSAGDDSADGCDATECTLREAIEEANATSGPATIRFAIPGDGVHTISPSTELPAITDELTIDGYSQPRAKPATA